MSPRIGLIRANSQRCASHHRAVLQQAARDRRRALLGAIEQLIIFSGSVAALYLTNLGATPAAHLAGCLIGIGTQPFCLHTTWHSRQWAFLALAVIFLSIYSAAAARHF